MRKTKTYRQIVLLGLLTVLLLTAACTRYNFDSEEEECYLDIYVYPPDRPIVTRADIDYQNANELESAVYSLQIWVFKHDTGETLGYLETVPSFTQNESKYRMNVSPAIVTGNDRTVDVYVLANVNENTCGLPSFTRFTTRDELDEAVISGTYFGVGTPGSETSPLTMAVPSGGLPMSGVLKNAPVAGSYPALRIGTDDQMATVKLARTVSKMRIILCRVHGESPAEQLHSITGIQIDGGQIPKEEYLMLGDQFNNALNPSEPLASSRIRINAEAGYENGAVNYGAITHEKIGQIPIVENPLVYVYNSKDYGTPQAYEDAIRAAAHPATGEPTLLDLGVTYLRESDQKLKGTISYKTEEDNVNGAEPKTISFNMDRAGDFTRDHSWIVYAFFSGGKLQVFNVVQVGIREWTPGRSENHDVYNW